MRSLGIDHSRHDDQVHDKQLIVVGRAAGPSEHVVQSRSRLDKPARTSAR